MFLLLIIALVFDLGNFALISLTNQEDCVRRCIKNIIDAYVDDVTTVLSIYGDFTRGNFLPHPMQVPIINIDVNQKVYNLNYHPGKELVFIDPVKYNFDEIRRLGFWNGADFSKRKFVFLFPNSASSHVQGLLHYLWKVDIIDVIFLVYDNKCKHRYAEVFVGNRHHPATRCGSVAANMSRFSCDTIKKNLKQKFFRNYKELADSDLPILIPRTSADVVLDMTHEGNQIFKKIKNKFRVLSDKEWQESHSNLQILENSSIMTGICNILAVIKALQRKINFIPDETLIRSELQTFSTKPGSYLIQDVNKVINSLGESGLIDYQRLIYKRAQRDYIGYYEEIQNSKENVALGMKHVFPIFLFWGCGMVIATVAFVLEHVTYYIKNR
ncbi:hypothetical protein FQA39_LY18481 [Lamprigera yunnana]|nr:hypothetical protein FQA39_LY18481 [Lamprigera yunnana]